MNEKEKDIILNGDIGQGENLVEAKMKQQQLKNSNYGKEKRSASKASSKGSGSTGSPVVKDSLMQKKEEKKYKFWTPINICGKQQ